MLRLDLFMLPFALLMLGSVFGIFGSGRPRDCGKNRNSFADDDDNDGDNVLNRWLLEITIGNILLLIFLLAFFFNPLYAIRPFTQDD